ncbi:PREDICTED: 39S ribosomal protein L19, mitochondrial isoform X2 [Polistes dominula]|uniref:Large ribosomal subunit protein bL19m n=1 Tax=Polistes dominula TaxID=743375 RepID=A0ABM1HUW1_POLDO|nr:PREDICTED: 39S ribosomal protein L19, mitochondrial isoform X2 [Polistes dominula]
MPLIMEILSHKTRLGLYITRTLTKEIQRCFSSVSTQNLEKDNQNTTSVNPDLKDDRTIPLNYRFIYPEFLPDPNPRYRNHLREKLERMDMIARRTQIDVPEFYVGSILAVTYTEPHAPGKVNKFVGICISRKGCGLRASFLLRNVIDNQGIEVSFDIYDPSLQKIDCLRLEKRLDNELFYLRDAPLEYSTFPFDMETELLPEGSSVPVNDIIVPLNPQPWLERWEQKELKGIKNIKISQNRRKKAKANAKPWEKYDLMKAYRETIPEEEQNDIFAEVQSNLRDLEIVRYKQKYTRTFVRPKKSG